MRKARVWWQIFRTIGGGMKAGRQLNDLFRYSVLMSLDQVGLYKFLEKPKSYGEILSGLHFVDGEYTRELLGAVVNDSRNVIRVNGEYYERNHDEPLPDFDDLMKRTNPRIRPLMQVAVAMSDNIRDRLMDERVDLPEMFERDKNKLVNMFHEVMGASVYSKVRIAVFSYLPRKEFDWLHGKKLLEVGCGSGRETAELWSIFGGDIRITAIDPVPSMIKLARENFTKMVKNVDPQHPPITSENIPAFEEGNAINLQYEDNTFEAGFFAIMLHWTSDPRKAIKELVRVVKPGGIILGSSSHKPYINPYVDLVIRSSRNSYGFCWKEEFIHWFEEEGRRVDIVTPAGIFRVVNTADENLIRKPMYADDVT